VSPEERRSEAQLERQVSEVIGRMPFLWVAVDDAPGPESERLVLERNLIALLSTAPQIDPPSQTWSGRFAAAEEIRTSGLWNVRHVGERHDRSVLDVFESAIRRTDPPRSDSH